MKRRWGWVGLALLTAAGWSLWAALALWLTAQSMPDAQGALWLEALRAHAGPMVLATMGLLALALVFWRGLDRLIWRAPRQLAERIRLLTRNQTAQPLDPLYETGDGGLADVAGRVAELVRQRDALRSDMQAQIDAASQAMQEERNRLAALMAELSQSVVVCNLDGRIILYNRRARLQLKALAGEMAAAARIGIGRSIYALLDRAMLAHALDNIRLRLARGASHPGSQFLTSTPSGQLLRVQMSPVHQALVGDDPTGTALAGFVLMLDNVTTAFAQEAERDQLLLALTEGHRAALANVQAAVEMLAFDDLEASLRERFLGVVRQEVQGMSARITALVAQNTEALKTRWPLEDMPGSDLVLAAQRRIQAQTGCVTQIESCAEDVWVKVDSFGLLQALTYLAGRLVDEFDVRLLHLRLQRQEGRVHLDLVWPGTAMSTETVMAWELDPMHLGQDRNPLTVRDVMDRHSGSMWFERERTRHRSFFRMVLPLSQAQTPPEPAPPSRIDSRPEFFDFDLFQSSAQHHDLDDRPLSSLTYTVFDTETTGLHPAQGDEIIQIGAARIVNGRLLRQETFEQLVDPGRRIPAASIPIHGITQAMVTGQPRIREVLPAFHAYAQDTVLVAHNAAFDMKFLALQEQATGLRFDQPVLDTLMLSAVIHPHQSSHRLEAIAERMHIAVLGRHTALGDALVTAEVFLRMIPLLAAQGITTLGQAREAAQKTYYARLKY